MKNKTQNLSPYLFLALLTLCACWLFAGRHGIFGAKVDWISQHSVLPEYFRQQFYETGELFPEFAANLGGGQNIYNFSYYGLFSPVILFSYLLPSVNMGTYLMAAGIAELILSIWLFYYWLGTRGFSKEIQFWSSVIFLLAGPMVYQSCHQIMFINYMPFLCLALVGVDRHLEQRKSGLYIIGVLLMILSSFYFSIGGILVLALYGLSRYLNLHSQKFQIGSFLKESFRFLLPTATAIFISGILLFPTALALLGKRQGASATDIFTLFMPQIQTESFLYNGYSVGLPSLILTVIIAGFAYRKWQDRILTYSCALAFLLPLFPWILNGGLYARSKSLIPFLPLLCYMIAVYMDKQKKGEISFFHAATAHLLTLLLLCYCHFFKGQMAHRTMEWPFILADAALMTLLFLAFWKSRRMVLMLASPALCLLLFGWASGNYWELVDPQSYGEITDKDIGKLISQTLDEEPQLCRLEQRGPEGEKGADLNRIWDHRQWVSSIYSSSFHADYRKFWKTEFQAEEPFRNGLMQASSNDPLYQKLMGIKYIVKNTKDEGCPGYEPCGTKGNWTVYKNENAAPIAYATDRVISEQAYHSLPFPYNQIAFMKYAVVKNAPETDQQWKSEIKAWANPAKLKLPQISASKANAAYAPDSSYRIQTKEDINAVGQIQDSVNSQNTLFYLQFHVKNNRPNQDVSIWVNGARNRLSARSHIYYNENTAFTYVTELEEGASGVEIVFGKGDYEIADVKCFLGDRRVLKEESNQSHALYQAKFQVDKTWTRGNVIHGKIKTQKKSWFITSIPYDSHFEVYVNGERTKNEKVNTAFLGFPVQKGENHVNIVYHAPGAKAGKALTFVGILLFGILLYAQKIQQKTR